jgi:20S proteasome subunit beta 7
VCPDEAAVANITREKAIEVVSECMKVLFYRDARSMNKYTMAIVSGEGDKVDIEWRKGVELKEQSWKFAEEIKGYGAQVV